MTVPSAVRSFVSMATAVTRSRRRKSGVPDACCTLAIRGRDQKRLVAMFKAMGNPIRFEVMKFLLTHPGCITGNIVEHLPIAQATVSQHLKVLRDAGLIHGTTEGKAVCYCLDPDAIAWFKSVVSDNF